MKRVLCHFLLVLMSSIILLLNPSNLSAQEIPETKDSLSNPTIIDHTLISEFTYGEKLKIVAVVREEIEWLGFFYRPKGMESFQVRKMESLLKNTYSYVLDTSILVSTRFDYYLAAQSKEGMIYLPKQAPQEFFEAVGITEEALPEVTVERKPPPEEERKLELPWSISINGSVGQSLKEEEAVAGEEKTLGDGNISVAKLYQKRNFKVSFASNLSYSSHPLEDEENFTLTDLILSLKGKNHTLQIGDLSIDESEFTILGLTRRGLDYTFDGQRLYVHLFDIGSQHEKGWGDLIPEPDLRFYGATLGYGFFGEKLSLKSVYLAGRDDPSQGRNVAGSFLESSEGSVVAVIPEVKLFKDKLDITGEFAQSSYDDNLGDEEETRKDKAWRVGTSISYPAFKLGGGYKRIGQDFGSVTNQFDSLFASDREGYEASLELFLGRVGLNLAYEDEQDNVDDDPTQLTCYDKIGTAGLSWQVSDRTSLTLGYGHSKQETFSDSTSEVVFQDSITKDASLGLTFALSPRMSVNVFVNNSDLTSKTDPSRDSSILTASLGGSFGSGKVLSLSPSLSYSRLRSEMSATETEIYSSFLSGELAIIPELLSLSTSGSFTRTEAGSENTTTDYTNISASLNWYMKGRILGLADSLLSLKYDLERTESEDLSDKSDHLTLEFNLSF